MKKLYSFTVAVIVLTACAQNAAPHIDAAKPDPILPSQMLVLADAEKITASL